MKDFEFWDKFYSDLERQLTNYKRPRNWRKRAANAGKTLRKPVLNQSEGRKGKHFDKD